MQKLRFLLLLLFSFSFCLLFSSSSEEMVRKLREVKNWKEESVYKVAPTTNLLLQTGYSNTPSARPLEYGSFGLGFSNNFPYKTINLIAQPFPRLQLNGNFRIFQEIPSLDLGSGYGDKSDKGVGLKILLLDSNDFPEYVPDISIGADDFLGTKAFKTHYVVATKTFSAHHLEVSAGYGKGNLDGLFAGLAWSPFQNYLVFPIDQFSFTLEYDSTKYRPSPYSRDLDHVEVKNYIVDKRGLDRYNFLNDKLKTKSPFNAGFFLRFGNFLNVSLAWERGKSVGGQMALVKDFESLENLIPKLEAPLPHTTPRNHQEIGNLREAVDLPYEFNYAFKHQGFQIDRVFMDGEKGEKHLHIFAENLAYWDPNKCKARLMHLLATLAPKNVETINVYLTKSGLTSHFFRFQKDKLISFREQKLSLEELALASPAKNYQKTALIEGSQLLYERKSELFSLSLSPDIITFWGSSKGKVKYAFGLKATIDGYFTNTMFYHSEISYDPISNLNDLSDTDKNNPSQIINVRSDNINYVKIKRPRISQLYLQKNFSPKSEHYLRASCGYFNHAYAGVAAEVLYAPVNSNLGLGFESALLKKRDYSGLQFVSTVRRLEGFNPKYEKFLGFQAFLDGYLKIPSINSRVKLSVGQFLAKDKGAKILFSKDFSSGLTLSTWLTVTDAKDKINNSRYHDYGFSLSIPLDIFSTKSLKSQWNYGMSAWLRDVGFRSSTGLDLYEIVGTEQPSS
ncbi:Uncharacterized protein AB751O23_AN_00160 [Chlamydiales bacterium SCGC AB-751-O23]|jgi:hypothetical protein|nr:Uncharacterized protein AB751O23_AN_00160 [Chlamydiales bacterium SCGC AB-751-O23]